MRKKNKIYSVLTLLLTTALCFSTTACSQTRQPAEPTPAQEETTVQEGVWVRRFIRDIDLRVNAERQNFIR